jgi:hypothetical protein
MTLSKAARRAVVGITAVMTLLCQGTALAHGCAVSAAQPAAVMAHSPCHDAGGSDSQDPARDAHPCLSEAAASSPALPDIPLLTGLPPLVVHAAAIRIAETTLPVFGPPPLRGEPPPLTILHCCLRN